jgi:phosphopantetheine adenylyltransferase
VREIASLGGDVSRFVAPIVLDALVAKLPALKGHL